MINPDSFYIPAQVLYTTGSLALFYSAIDNLLIKRRKIPKKSEGEIDLSGIEDTLPNITLMIPAYKEQKVIANTVDVIANLHYPKNKYTSLFLVDEKEDIAKAEEGKVIVPLAMDIIKKGGFVYENLFNHVKEKNPKFSNNGLKKATDNYVKSAQLLVMSFLRKNYKVAYGLDGEHEKRMVTDSFSILNGSERDGEQDGQLEKIVNNTFYFLKDVNSFSRQILSEELWNTYNSHCIFNTTKDEVEKTIKEKYSGKESPVIDFAVVPNTFEGEYKGKLLDHRVPSSKGRALNYGLSVIDEKYPQTKIIGIYDADGRPHREVLAYIAKESMKIPENRDFFFQGPIYLVRNFDQVDWVCKQSGLTGTLWHSMLYPAKVMKSNRPGINKITHFSGTNYFFTKRVVENVGGWPPFHPTEDLGIAYQVYMDYLRGNIEKPIVKPHPYEEIEQTTQNFSIWFKQQYRWASGYRYQAREVIKSDLPIKHKITLVSKLFQAPVKSSIAFIAGVSGLSLLASTALGYTQSPNYLVPGLNEFMRTTMTVGFAGFMAIQPGIYLWSLKNKYIPHTSTKNVIKNVLQITATNIPYSILSTVPTLVSWVKGLKGWGAKTPRTEERIASKEQKYLEEILAVPNKKPASSSLWYQKIYGQHFKDAEEKGLKEITLTKRATVDYIAFNLGISRPVPLSREYSEIVTKHGLFDSFYKFKQKGEKWLLSEKI